jgi:hypothetical protein
VRHASGFRDLAQWLSCCVGFLHRELEPHTPKSRFLSGSLDFLKLCLRHWLLNFSPHISQVQGVPVGTGENETPVLRKLLVQFLQMVMSSLLRYIFSLSISGSFVVVNSMSLILTDGRSYVKRCDDT